MKVAIASSLQGAPEEFSGNTPVDCYRLSMYIYEQLVALFPQVTFDLFNRDDFPGAGDAYIALRNAIVAWGANAAVHIHQDAGGGAGARGWHIIYYHDASLPLCYTLESTIDDLPSPERYGGIVRRTDVAAVKAPPVSVLIEAGFYTSAEDEAIGIAGWGDAIVGGVSLYLQQLGYNPNTNIEEDDEVVPFERVRNEKGQGKFTGKDVACFRSYGKGTDYIHLSMNVASEEDMMVFINVREPTRYDLPASAQISKGYAGVVTPLWAFGMGKNEYAWVGVHVPLEKADLFSGFIRK